MTFLPEIKKCCRCGKIKSQDEFNLRGKSPDGLAARCMECYTLYQREDRSHKNYGITEVQYNLMLKSQNGVCKICKQPETVKQYGKVRRLSVDHCHKTNKVRGLLCLRCNTLLAHVENRPEILEAIPKYLQKENE